MTSRAGWLVRAVLGALMALPFSTTAFAQEAQPQRLRLGFTRVTNGAAWLEAQKIVNEAYKKANAPFRDVWVATLFGETNLRVTVSPVTTFSQFDQPGPMSKLTEGERTRVTALTRDAVESTRYVLAESLPAASLFSNRTEAANFARITIVRVHPGKSQEYEALLKTLVLPAWKTAGAKDIWSYRGILGGPVAEYIVVQLFDKWAELDAWPAGEKLMGAAGYKQYLTAVAGIVDGAETLVMRRNPDASYRMGN